MNRTAYKILFMATLILSVLLLPITICVTFADNDENESLLASRQASYTDWCECGQLAVLQSSMTITQEWVAIASYANPWKGDSEGARADKTIRDRLITNCVFTAVRGLDVVVMIVPKVQAATARILVSAAIKENALNASVIDTDRNYPEYEEGEHEHPAGSP